MHTIKFLLATAIIAALGACASAPTTHTQAAPGAVGTLVVREEGVLRLANGGTGQGTLTLRGWEYPFEVSNMTLSALGPGSIQLEGDVYNADSPQSFEGTYQLMAADVDSGQGAEGFWFENDNGVRVHIRSEGQDVTVRLQGGGSVVTLK